MITQYWMGARPLHMGLQAEGNADPTSAQQTCSRVRTSLSQSMQASSCSLSNAGLKRVSIQPVLRAVQPKLVAHLQSTQACSDSICQLQHRAQMSCNLAVSSSPPRQRRTWSVICSMLRSAMGTAGGMRAGGPPESCSTRLRRPAASLSALARPVARCRSVATSSSSSSCVSPARALRCEKSINSSGCAALLVLCSPTTRVHELGASAQVRGEIMLAGLACQLSYIDAMHQRMRKPC